MAQQSPKVHPLAFPKKPLPVLPPQNDVIHAPAPLPPGPGTRQSINRTSCIRKPINLVKAYAPSAPEEDYEVNAENLPTNEYIDGYYEYSDATGETFEPDGSFAVALWNFTGERDTDLNFNKGDKIKIIRRFSNGWWEGEIDNVIGDFPCNFVEIVENVDITYDEPYSQQQQEYEKFDDDSDSSSGLVPPQFSPNVNVPLGLRSSNPHVPLKKELPIKEGFLTKKGHKRRNWKVRYFVLEKNLLSYYKSPQDYLAKRKPKGSIILQRSTMVRVAPEMKRSNCFTVSGGLGLLYITAPTGEDMVIWMEKISAAKVKI